MQLIGLGLAFAVALALALTQASAQGATSGVERLYILNCGEGVAGDISRWSPGVNVGKSMDFADSCYLIKHAQGCGTPASPMPSPPCPRASGRPIRG